MAVDVFPHLFSNCCDNLNSCCSWPEMLAYALAFFCCGEVRLQVKGGGVCVIEVPRTGCINLSAV